MNEIRPRLKGLVHYIAFLITVGLSVIYLLLTAIVGWCNGFAVYLLAQLLLFGISSKYHRTVWRTEKLRRLVQRLDHASIFVLIAGTQTAVALLLLPMNKLGQTFIFTTWIISVVGIMKVIFLSAVYETVDVVFYIIHGVVALPFINLVIKSFNAYQIVCFFMGGISYILGGVLFRLRKPNPNPHVFGYHEVFHVFTVVANLFYMIPILEKYISIVIRSIKDYK